ncbi:unnamed protein product [Cuscuta campestris]|uniref:Uncharacterized protein n=2 Tax=Cuscuta sect. Cleistogrammica TaxID=1824901 RepID=A0A484NAW6_9ASTE|nr:hypothetical protein DM860_018247 [Cuscuta australis]VFQ98029.1 unnamed protein product [Cuscuta campestris]
MISSTYQSFDCDSSHLHPIAAGLSSGDFPCPCRLPLENVEIRNRFCGEIFKEEGTAHKGLELSNMKII